jgi:hypothetical protein
MNGGRDAYEPGLTGNETEDTQHYPFERPLHLGWHRDGEGNWAWDSTDDWQWEVICEQCGDTGGPAEEQSETVCKLRGPYPSKHKARHAADGHFKEWGVPPRWTPGSATPNIY